MSSPDRRCICRHHETSHAFDPSGSICAVDGCPCLGFYLWEVKLENEFGKRFSVTDIRKFVTENKDLFFPEDLEPRQRKSSGHCYRTNNAEYGLYRLVEKTQETYRGWSVITFPKTFKP